MSIWTSIRDVARATITKAIPGLGAASLAYDAAKMAKKGAAKVRALPGKGVIAGGGAGYAAASYTRGEGKPRRRINYANGKAASRAIRRVKGTMKMLKRIEKMLPTRTVRSRSTSRSCK